MGAFFVTSSLLRSIDPRARLTHLTMMHFFSSPGLSTSLSMVLVFFVSGGITPVSLALLGATRSSFPPCASG